MERARSECISLYESWMQEFAKQHPTEKLSELKRDGEMQVQSIERGVSVLRDQFSSALTLLMAGVGLVLLMVCSNVAGLLLERATARQRETAVRLAVGASQARLMRQWLTESLLLALLGGLLGVALAWAAMPVLSSLIPPLRNRVGELLMLDPNFALNRRVLVFSFAVCVLVAVIAGLAPALRAGRHDLSLSLRSSRSSSKVEGGITILQIALCTLLLVEAGLFARTLTAMRTMDLGFDRDHIAAFTLRAEHAVPKVTFREVLPSEAKQLPGVRGAALASRGLLRGTGFKATVGLLGERPPRSEFLNSSTNRVSPEYFDMMGIRILAGRGLTMADIEGSRVVVNQTLARRFFPGQDPIGKRFGSGFDVLTPNYEIVGVVSDAQYRSLREPIPSTFYSNGMNDAFILHLRAAGDPASLIGPVRELVRKLAPGWSVYEVNLLRDEAERSHLA